MDYTKRAPIKDRFKGNVAIVTGGTTGIGRAIADELCKEGASVAITGRHEVGAEKEMGDAGYDVTFIQGDMAEESFCEKVVAETAAKWGKINYLVNNAFSFIAKGMDATRRDWEIMFSVGPFGYAKMIQLVAPHMREAGGGSIVNMSSISCRIAQVNRWTYNAAKGAVNQLTRCAALDLAPWNIRVNTVSPGWIWTREVLKAAGGDKEKYDPIWGEYHILGRCGEPVECAGPTLFLLSDDASFITGTDLCVDGGYNAIGSEGLGKTATFAGSE
ncbi:MAG TPA: SDR family oxidoreductase [Candidatus Hydrogenedentes bacterium]|nr:SDR family oxidoreductase [Candidatus Hydrogenedentota bacterium]HIJ75060.1 SDR family oxidoreductase [Candidatus Hydrogenedentota bacterium]